MKCVCRVGWVVNKVIGLVENTAYPVELVANKVIELVGSIICPAVLVLVHHLR